MCCLSASLFLLIYCRSRFNFIFCPFLHFFPNYSGVKGVTFGLDDIYEDNATSTYGTYDKNKGPSKKNSTYQYKNNNNIIITFIAINIIIIFILISWVFFRWSFIFVVSTVRACRVIFVNIVETESDALNTAEIVRKRWKRKTGKINKTKI